MTATFPTAKRTFPTVVNGNVSDALAQLNPIYEEIGALEDALLGNILFSPQWKGPRPWIDVRAYGAKGDGVTDDTTALQAAFTAGAGGVVYGPIGTYIYSAKLRFPNNIVVFGAGRDLTVFKQATASNLPISFDASSSTPTNIRIAGITFDGNRTGQSSGNNRGLEITTASATITKIIVEDCTWQNYRAAAIVLGGSSGGQFKVSGSYIRRNVFSNNGGQNDNGMIAVQSAGGDATHVDDNTFISFPGVGTVDAILHGASTDFVVHGNYANGVTLTFLDIGGSVRGTVTDNIAVSTVLAFSGVDAENSTQKVAIKNNRFIGPNSSGATGRGIFIQSGVSSSDFYNQVEGNYLEGTQHGIVVSGSYNIISTNIIRVPRQIGIYLAAAGGNNPTSNIIKGNIIDSPSQDGAGTYSAIVFATAIGNYVGDWNEIIGATHKYALEEQTGSVNNAVAVNYFPSGVSGRILLLGGSGSFVLDTSPGGVAPLVLSNSGLQIAGGWGLSQTASASRNLRGAATFASAATVAVTFGTAELDANYFVSISGNASQTFWVTAKSTGGFTLNSSNATSTATVDWMLIR
jgi:hypothetical protein